MSPLSTLNAHHWTNEATNMTINEVTSIDLSLLAKWNRQLQEDEGATVMSLEAIEARFREWFARDYKAVIFEEGNPVRYALFRPCDPDSEGPGYYLRQFFIDREERRKGYGKSAFHCLRENIFANH